MTCDKRRYRRVHTEVIDRAWWRGTKITMFQDGTWWLNAVGVSEGFERPRRIVLDGVHIDPFKDATPHQRKYGIVTVRTLTSFCPLDYGGRQAIRHQVGNRSRRVPGGLAVPR